MHSAGPISCTCADRGRYFATDGRGVEHATQQTLRAMREEAYASASADASNAWKKGGDREIGMSLDSASIRSFGREDSEYTLPGLSCSPGRPSRTVAEITPTARSPSPLAWRATTRFTPGFLAGKPMVSLIRVAVRAGEAAGTAFPEVEAGDSAPQM
jgi:hypothetical protein